MVRDDVKELYKELTFNELSFIPRGRQSITSIYEYVENKYPNLCDDNFLCSDNCQSGNNDPEWHHAVRRALDRLKKISKYVEKDKEQYYWILK